MEILFQRNLLASWYQRSIGAIIDFSFCNILAVILNEFIYLRGTDYSPNFSFNLFHENQNDPYVKLYTAIIYVLYCFLMEVFFNKTIGKFVTGTKVKHENAFDNPSKLKIFIRNLCRLIPFDGLSFISAKPRGWHDSLSKTVVINNINEQHPYKRFLNGYKMINKGFIRLHFAISFIISIIIGRIEYSKLYDSYYDMNHNYHIFSNEFTNELLYCIIIAFLVLIIYWILVRICIWIIDGFKEEK